MEVVCGVLFEPIPELDALTLGIYWDRRSQIFPKRALQPALQDEFNLLITQSVQVRAVMSTEDGQFLIQLQHDRFFMNWRSTGATYPRFSEKHGSGGLLVRAMGEFEQFSSFVAQRLGKKTSVRAIDLTKVDLLERDKHWRDFDQLAEIVPLTGSFRPNRPAENREINLRFVERGSQADTFIHLATLMRGDKAGALRIEGRCQSPAFDSLAAPFEMANQVINEAFFQLIPNARELFGTKGSS